MAILKRSGDNTRYDFTDKDCLGRECFAAGMYQHRSPMSCGGSRNTGSPDTPCCLNRAYRGCPRGPVGEHTETCFLCAGEYVPCSACVGLGTITVSGLPVVNPALLKQRKAEGWKAL